MCAVFGYHKYDFTIATSIFGSSEKQWLGIQPKMPRTLEIISIGWDREEEKERQRQGHRPTHKMQFQKTL